MNYATKKNDIWVADMYIYNILIVQKFPNIIFNIKNADMGQVR